MNMIRSALLFVLGIVLAGITIGQVPRSDLKDPVSLLARQSERGEVKLDYSSDGWGYLVSLLKRLDINIDSQVLVFSKTSFQLSKISPHTPRAIYFNDSV